MNWLSDPESWVALLTLLSLEIVLGIDNVIFIAILTGKLPEAKQARARTLGLAMAMLTRVALLFSLAWIARLTDPLFSVRGHDFDGRDLILLAGGMFLLTKSTREIHARIEGDEEHGSNTKKPGPSFARVIVEIMVLDMVFSLDSVITAVGMVDEIGIMVTAVIVAVGIMMIAAGAISCFVERHPTIKMLALSFLLLIGGTLVAEGWGQHIAKGYIYFAMGFSVFVEFLNLRARRKATAKAGPPLAVVPGAAEGERAPVDQALP